MAPVRERITNFSRRFKSQPPSAIEKERAAAQAQRDSPSSPLSNGSGSTGTAYTSSSGGTSPASSLNLRPPQNNRTGSMVFASAKDFVLPDLPWLCGTWHVTHSTLPMWRDKRNVRILYTRLPGDKLDDVATYQSQRSPELQRVHGIDRPRKDGSYTWRGKGMLQVASSRWEVLGWGGGGQTEEQWVVTYFARTVFTPAGIDIYSRRQAGLSEATLRKLMAALQRLDGSKDGDKSAVTGFGKLVGQLFEIKRDDARAALTP